jgi:hypothetical protein
VVTGGDDKEASQTRDYCVAKDATQRAARPDPSLREERLLGMTGKVLSRQELKTLCSRKQEMAVGLNER